MTLGRAIRERRLELGLTQEALAQLIGDGVRQAEVSRLESNRVTLPRRRRLERIAHALGLSITELLTRSGWAEPTPSSDEPSNGRDPEVLDLRRGSRARFARAAQIARESSDDLTNRSLDSFTRVPTPLPSSTLYSGHRPGPDGEAPTDRRVHAKWLDGSLAANVVSFVSDSLLADGPDTLQVDDFAAPCAVPQDYAAGPIAHVIDRLTAATLEAASIQRNVAAKHHPDDQTAIELRALEQNLKEIGAILRNLHDQQVGTDSDNSRSDS